MWNLFWPPVCPGYNFLTELYPESVSAPLPRVPAAADFGSLLSLEAFLWEFSG